MDRIVHLILRNNLYCAWHQQKACRLSLLFTVHNAAASYLSDISGFKKNTRLHVQRVKILYADVVSYLSSNHLINARMLNAIKLNVSNTRLQLLDCRV